MSDALILKENKKSLDQLFQIQTQVPPSPIRNLPTSSNIYDIDLNTRSVQSPKVLSVSRDHKSMVVYFRIDRFFDYMDLSETVCLVQYVPYNHKGAPYTYVVPFFDILSQEDSGKMIFPWVVGGPATSSEGVLQFAIRFYRVDTNEDGDVVLTYNLNTTPSSTTVLYGLESDDAAMKLAYDEPIAKEYENLISQLSNQATRWTLL